MKNKEIHEMAIEYYKNKIEKFGRSYDDSVEILFHQLKSNPDENLISDFLEISDEISPVHYGFKRLIDVGEGLKNYFKGKHKAPILGTLGNLYSDLRRFEDSEKAYQEALKIRKRLAEKNPDVYLPSLATTQNNLGVLYRELRRFEDSEKVYQEALKIRKRLAEKNPDVYLPSLATTQNNLGVLYSDLRRFEDSEKVYQEALKIRKRLAEKNPDVYLPDLLQTQANFGMFYIDTNRTEDGIITLESVLKRKSLLPDFGAKCFAALGRAHEKLKNPQDATQNYLFASANYFLLFREGVPCLNEVLNYLKKVAELGNGEIKGDAELMLTAIRKLMGQEVTIPQFPFSKRGEALKEALNGRKVKFHPENEIDLMAIILIEDILS